MPYTGTPGPSGCHEKLPRVPRRILGVWTEMSSTEPKAPGHLKAETRRWWAEVAERWDLEEHHRRILTLCAEAWDTGQAAGALLRREGLVVTTKDGGPRAHPAVKIQPGRPAAILPRHSRGPIEDLEPPAGSEATARAAGQSRGKWRAPKTASRESADDGHEDDRALCLAMAGLYLPAGVPGPGRQTRGPPLPIFSTTTARFARSFVGRAGAQTPASQNGY